MGATWGYRRSAVIGAMIGGCLVPIVANASAARVGLGAAAGAILACWAHRLTTATAVRRRILLSRVAAGVGLGTLLVVAQFGAIAAVPGPVNVPLEAFLVVSLGFVTFTAAFGAVSGENVDEDAREAGPPSSEREAAIQAFGLRGFARRAAQRLSAAHGHPADATRKLDDTKSVEGLD